MKIFHQVFRVFHFIISILFVVSALALIFLSCLKFWEAFSLPTAQLPYDDRVNTVLRSLALLTVSVAALELGQTILEEEVQREADMSAPTRVRRFLSRFLVVLVVSLSIETLVLVFEVGHVRPEQLPYAASVGVAAGVLLVSWAVFIRLNRSAEDLEPEAMEQAKKEDRKVES
jgi:hypothetical protein